jgi:tetratricopeptide (TPR) repeat protein
VDLLRRSANQHNFVLFRADKAFSALWEEADFQAAADIGALYENDLAEADKAIRGDPGALFPVILRMSALWRLGRFDDAVRLGEEMVASDLSRFRDVDYREAQLYEQLARALEMKGDIAGAERAFRSGVDRLTDKTETVVTLMMSAGQFLATTSGKYDDALQMADRADSVARQVYGQGIGDSVRALAYWGLGQRANLDRIVAYVEKNLAESQSIAIDLYLLLGRSDDAAKLVARQLADPARADVMLVALQRYTKNRPPVGAVEKTLQSGWEALRLHPLVIEALRAVGRIVDVPAANRY